MAAAWARLGETLSLTPVRRLLNNQIIKHEGGVVSWSCRLRPLSTKTSDREDFERKLAKKYTRFMDSLRVHVKAGTGGQGLPDKGGIGGKGGDVLLVGTKREEFTLKDVLKACPTKRFSASTGEDARFFCLYGKNAKSIEILVPRGITVLSETGQTMGEINKAGDKVVVAKGGMGGGPCNGFSAQKGQAHNITLDLKLIADVGFLGFPNAGKSTLLRALSKATPKVASYPFTTISPNIGTMEFTDYRKIVLADLPGLVEGAHANQGMGHKFLKHVERTKMLLFIVDLHGFQLSPQHPFRSALETIVLLNRELELYQTDLTDKPAVLALNKIDLPHSYSILDNVRNTLTDKSLYAKFLETLPPEFQPTHPIRFEDIVPISAKTDVLSVTNLKNVLRKQIDVCESYSTMLDKSSRTSIFS